MIRALVAVMLVACGPGVPGGPTMNNKMAQDANPPVSPVVSADILAREPVANTANVKHILIGWKDLGGDQKDPRAAKRSKKDAEDQVRALLTQIKAGADFDALMKQWSEDPGSASSGHSYPVTPDAQLVIEFKNLGLKLKVGEVGVVESDFGFHIMKRIE
jgi:hypothetical protein